jgi:hypothetical protein
LAAPQWRFELFIARAEPFVQKEVGLEDVTLAGRGGSGSQDVGDVRTPAHFFEALLCFL